MNFWSRCGRRLKGLTHVLWACRASAAGGIAGIALFGVVPQARDLFADTSRSFWWALGYWTSAFFSLAFVWAFMAHYTARMALIADDWLIPRGPRLVMPAHEQARVYGALRAKYSDAIDYAPRFLGLLPFVAMAAGMARETGDLWNARGFPPAWDAIVQILWLFAANAAVAAGFFAVVVKRKQMVGRLRAKAARMDRGPGSSGTDKAFQAGLKTLSLALDFEGGVAVSAAQTAMAGWVRWMTHTALFLAVFWPIEFGEWVSRAMLMPLLFGGATWLFAWFCQMSNRSGLPVVAGVIVASMAITAGNVHFNDVRTVPDSTVGQRIGFDEAVTAWKQANGCPGPVTCPPALIVAAEGGASRAAFFTDTILGALFDTQPPGDEPPTASPWAATRMFAISSVSGSSAGAVVARAALSENTPGQAPPCVRAHDTWFRFHDDRETPRTWRDCLQVLNTVDALTPVFVGMGYRDNLAPGWGKWRWDDRAGLLERAWERAYAKGVGDTGPGCADGATRHGLCRRIGDRGAGRPDALSPDGKWVPLLFLNSTSVESGGRIVVSEVRATWTPLDVNQPLYSEAYDVFEMMAAPCPGPAIDLNPNRCRNGDQVVAAAPDLWLSTAAIMSARFPVISPPGTIFDSAKKDVGRFVDGGVFENSGLTTANDIARALLRRGIVPVILHINNDPVLDADDLRRLPKGDPKRQVIPPRESGTPSMPEQGAASYRKRFFGTIGGPVEALYETRSGHGQQAAWVLNQELEAKCPYRKCYFDINVWAKPKLDTDQKPKYFGIVPGDAFRMESVSMSWWMSPPVQAFLDVQLYDKRNAEPLDEVRSMLRERRRPNP